MKPPGSNMTSFLGRPASIARLFSLDEKGDALWTPEEMQAMWRHQLSASLQTELSGGTSLPAGAPRNQGTVNLAGSPKSTKSDASLSPKTFGELFTAPQPSFDLLNQTKNLAKRMVKDATDKQFKDVAAALYYTSYAAALACAQKRLGGLGDEDLKRGFKWLLDQPWLDESTHSLIAKANKLLEAGAGPES